MKGGLVATAAVALALLALAAWNDLFSLKPTWRRRLLDGFGRLVAYAGKEAAACSPQDARTRRHPGRSPTARREFRRGAAGEAHGARVVNFFDGSCWIARSPLYGADWYSASR
ncbi:MAG: hypothetical protein U1E30_03170 [Rhodoblastus sp.]